MQFRHTAVMAAAIYTLAGTGFARAAATVTWTGGDYTWTNSGDNDSFSAAFNPGDSVILSDAGITNATVGQTQIALTGSTSLGTLTLQTNTGRFTSGTTGSNAMASNGFNYLIQSDSGEAISATGNLELKGGVLIFDRPNTSPDGNPVHTFGGALSYSGGNFLSLRSQSGTRAVSLQVASLANPTAGNTIAFGQMNSAANTGTSGLGWNSTNTRVIITGSKPTTTAVGTSSVAMVPGAFQMYAASTAGEFMKLDSNNLIPFVGTDYTTATTALNWTDATSASVLVTGGSLTLTTGATAHAVKFLHNMTFNDVPLTLTGATLSTNNQSISSNTNGGIKFGSTGAGHGFIGAWNAGNAGTISANLITTGGITIFGNQQELSITGTNSGLSGGIYLNGTPTRLGATSANGNVITIASLGQLIVSGTSGAGQTTTIGGLAGSGNVSGYVRGTGASSSTLLINTAANTAHSSSARITDGSTGRAIGLTKSGDGKQTLSGVASYTGPTAINAGTLIINGDFSAATNTYTVAANATLGGSGTIGGLTTVNGIVSPGNSIGTLTVTNDVTWNSNNAWRFELGAIGQASLALANTAPSNNDRLAITGTGSDFLKGTGSAFTFDFAGTGGSGWYKLVDWAGTSDFVAGDFAASNLASGLTATFTVDSTTSALYINVVPEPTTLATLSVAAMMLGRRRRVA